MPAIHNGIGVSFRSQAFGGAAPVNLYFVSEWDTTQAGSASDTVVLPLLSGGTYDGTIDWGDGSSSVLSYANRTHTYAAGGTYTITISGADIQGWRFANTGDRRKIIDISNWGNLTITGDKAFQGCSKLDISATDAPTLSANISNMLRDCPSLTTPDFSNWDTSGVTDMSLMFYNCTKFNGDITTWDVSNVQTFVYDQSGFTIGIFSNCYQFNQDISSWDISSVSRSQGRSIPSLSGMFSGCFNFNQDLSGWDFSNIERMANMFINAYSFNQDVNGWNVSGVNISGMFRGARAFNQDVTTFVNNAASPSLRRFLYDARAFNQDVSGWNVSTVTNMAGTFRECNASGFNPDISGWNVSNVTIFSDGQGGMLQNADGFDRDLSSWDITSMTNAQVFMFQSSGMSTANYDATLIGWEATLQAAFPSGAGYTPTVSINFGGSQYTTGGAGETARTSLISTFGWTITDGGGV